jgi:beta-galactosidase
MLKNLLIIAALLICVPTLRGQTFLPQTDLSQQPWKLWLDETAEWQNDSLFLPPVTINQLPVNAPTIGWQELKKSGIDIMIPATVEEYYWGKNGSRFGITGDYTGVSWFTTSIVLPSEWKGKRIALDFESVRMRAEIYVNEKLAGYDLINGTPFSVDITDVVKWGEPNFLAVRITDPNGNFAWRDWETYAWGKYQTPPSHGFGGITGNVKLEVTDNTYISDVYVQNTPALRTVNIEVELEAKNATNGGIVTLELLKKGEKKVLATKKIVVQPFSGSTITKEKISYPKAELWDIDNPQLYVIAARWKGNDKSEDLFNRTFGFRWFDVTEVNGDKQFVLNGKRIVLRTAISWGHWPVNGIYPTDQLARKQIETAKKLGLNMLNFHRGIGQTKVFDYADELGLLYYEEPGGYRPGEGDPFAMAWKREKLLRMIKRDRNHPSLVIYNMINESNRDPQENEIRDIQDAHKLDPSRIITFTSTFFGKTFHDGNAPFGEALVKMHMLPNNNKVLYYGWYDEHHAGGPGVYKEHFYKSPTDFMLYRNHPTEIIFWGEDGAVGTAPRLELINKEFAASGNLGWDGDTYTALYDAYRNFITTKGFSDAFPTVDALTLSMGAVAHYYHGKIIENIRAGNITDGYAVNGWESTKVENHSGIVDIYRNSKADPAILSYYNQPLYVAVKLRNKVMETGKTAVADIYVINEKDYKGAHELTIYVADASGEKTVQTKQVNLAGGNTYGQLLLENVSIDVIKEGYTTVRAELKSKKEIVATGHDQVYAVGLLPAINQQVTVLDTSGIMQKVLKAAGVNNMVEINNANNIKGNMLVVGNGLQPGLRLGQFRMNDPLMDWVARGNTMLVLHEPENWGEYFSHKEILDFRGTRAIGENWFGGNFFVRQNPYFDGLPQNTAFNWEYQALAGYNMHRVGLRLENDICYVGVSADHKRELYSAFSVINHGKGKIVLSTLDVVNAILNNENGNAVAKKLIQNCVTK